MAVWYGERKDEIFIAKVTVIGLYTPIHPFFSPVVYVLRSENEFGQQVRVNPLDLYISGECEWTKKHIIL